MSKEVREQINKVKNFGQFLNENINNQDTKQKRLNLAKTLMSLKESLDTVSESKELMLLKKKVADIHKEVEKAIEETTKKK